MKRQLGKQSVYILFAFYFFIVAIFLAALFWLPSWFENLEKNYAGTVQKEVNTILENTEQASLAQELDGLRKTYPMELAIYKDKAKVYQSIPKLTLVELRNVLQEEGVLLEASGDVHTKKGSYFVWYSIYHPSIMTYLKNVTTYQLIAILLSFTVLMVALFLVFKSTIMPLQKLKTRLSNLESYELDSFKQEEMQEMDALNKSVTRFATNLQDKFQSISRNYTDLEYALQLEKERLSNLVTVSRGVIHDLKSPVHQTLIENDLFLQQEPENQLARQISNYNIERMEKIMQQINDVLNLLNTDIKEMIEVQNEFDIVSLLKEIRNSLNTYRMQKDLFLDIIAPETLFVTLNKASLHLIIHNLLSNAVKYAQSDTEITFKIEETKEAIIISCANVATIDNINMMKKTEGIFFIEDEEHEFSSGTGMFLIRELTQVIGGTYQLVQDETTVTVICTMQK